MLYSLQVVRAEELLVKSTKLRTGNEGTNLWKERLRLAASDKSFTDRIIER